MKFFDELDVSLARKQSI